MFDTATEIASKVYDEASAHRSPEETMPGVVEDHIGPGWHVRVTHYPASSELEPHGSYTVGRTSVYYRARKGSKQVALEAARTEADRLVRIERASDDAIEEPVTEEAARRVAEMRWPDGSTWDREQWQAAVRGVLVGLRARRFERAAAESHDPLSLRDAMRRAHGEGVSTETIALSLHVRGDLVEALLGQSE